MIAMLPYNHFTITSIILSFQHYHVRYSNYLIAILLLTYFSDPENVDPGAQRVKIFRLNRGAQIYFLVFHI